MKLRDQVVETILSFEEPFAIADIYSKLREKGISIDNDVLSIIEEIFELPSIRSVPFSNKYYISWRSKGVL